MSYISTNNLGDFNQRVEQLSERKRTRQERQLKCDGDPDIDVWKSRVGMTEVCKAHTQLK
jgi:hypothetical protein